MRGLEKNAPNGAHTHIHTHTHTHTQRTTYRHGNSMTESAQKGQFCENVDLSLFHFVSIHIKVIEKVPIRKKCQRRR